MLGITIILGVALYIATGLLFSDVTTNHVNDLCKKVAEYDPRYCERMWFHITLKKTKTKEFIVDVAFLIIWPVACIAAILKAEREYDLIVHHSAFTNKPV